MRAFPRAFSVLQLLCISFTISVDLSQLTAECPCEDKPPRVWRPDYLLELWLCLRTNAQIMQMLQQWVFFPSFLSNFLSWELQ